MCAVDDFTSLISISIYRKSPVWDPQPFSLLASNKLAFQLRRTPYAWIPVDPKADFLPGLHCCSVDAYWRCISHNIQRPASSSRHLYLLLSLLGAWIWHTGVFDAERIPSVSPNERSLSTKSLLRRAPAPAPPPHQGPSAA
jgi:hypothetical protein